MPMFVWAVTGCVLLSVRCAYATVDACVFIERAELSQSVF